MNINILIAIIALAAGGVGGFYLAKFVKAPKSEKIEIIKNWLLYAVALAENELGAGTGKLKLAKVYNMFVKECSELANYVTFEEFSKLVDEVLDKFREILNTNENIETIINGDYSIQ
jgi:hypothetical protein